MSDSVDRVFSHALNTVNKIRTGSEKPPSSTRLKLYGLYKQSMEGDVEGIMERPNGKTDEDRRAQEKWDAWKQQSGLSRTEAKRRYITTLIETMHQYASPSPDARELVDELSFIWDQVKSNVPSSSSSSPLQTLGVPPLAANQDTSSFPGMGFSQDSRSFPPTSSRPQTKPDAPMKILSPLSQSEVEDPSEDDDEDPAQDEEEFVDAQDSQYEPPSPSRDPGGDPSSRAISKNPRDTRPRLSPTDQKWRRRIESSLIKMTAEIAALREQLEARPLFGRSTTRKARILRWLSAFGWNLGKWLLANIVLLGVLLWWQRWRGKRALERKVRGLLGDGAKEGYKGLKEVQKVGIKGAGLVGITGKGRKGAG